MRTTNCLIIESCEELERWGSSRKILNDKSDGYQGELCLGQFHSDSSFRLSSSAFSILMRLMQRLRCTRLTLRHVIPISRLNYKGTKCWHLSAVTMTNNRANMFLVPFLLEFCPNLQSLSDEKIPPSPFGVLCKSKPMPYCHREATIRRIKIVIREVDRNCRLIDFKSSSIADEIESHLMYSCMDNDELQKYNTQLLSLVQRNLCGYRKCRASIYHLLLIKKHRPDSIFSLINRDCVNIIARLLHATIGTEVWCH